MLHPLSQKGYELVVNFFAKGWDNMLSAEGVVGSGRKTQEFEGLVHLGVEQDILPVQRSHWLGWVVELIAFDAGQQWLEDFVAQDHVGAEGPKLPGLAFIATAPGHALGQTLASSFGQVIGGPPGRILLR